MLYCTLHTDTQVTAGVCPKCADIFPDILPNVYQGAKVRSASDNIEVSGDMKKIRELQAHLDENERVIRC